MVEEWYCEANNRVDAEALTRFDVEKSLGVVKQEQLELSERRRQKGRLRSSAKNFIELR